MHSNCRKMSSKSSHHRGKHRNKHDSDRVRARSRSRSPRDGDSKKHRSHRSEKQVSNHNQHRHSKEEVVSKSKVKSEPADKGYKKYEYPSREQAEREAFTSRWDDDDNTGRQEGGRKERRREEPQVRVKQEHERNDERRERRREPRKEGSLIPPIRPLGLGENTIVATDDGDDPAAPKEGPNFGLSGALTEDTNTFRGIVIKYNEPPEARKPKMRWRLYVFKGDEEMPTLYIHRQSAYLLGRERLIADLPIDHPSCSKQHAAIQYRLVEYEKSDGTIGKRVRPYIIDLESANGTFLNNKQIEPRRYYELQEKDMLKFGFSSREYIVLHEKTSTAELDDPGEA